MYSAEASNKKADDMRKRCQVIDGAKPCFTVSIHQNSYHEETIKGAQVFYYEQSAEGKEIAECIQKHLIERVDNTNKRVAKANGSYYLLRKTQQPTVIVECGFLSNREDCANFNSPSYRSRLCLVLFASVCKYFDGTGS